jgi:hypothetical protein
VPIITILECVNSDVIDVCPFTHTACVPNAHSPTSHNVLFHFIRPKSYGVAHSQSKILVRCRFAHSPVSRLHGTWPRLAYTLIGSPSEVRPHQQTKDRQKYNYVNGR